jgi:two-component system, NtrC family, sensor kinase
MRHSIEMQDTSLEVQLNGPLLVCGDGHQLGQVVLNMLLNSAQALKKGGDIAIRGQVSGGDVCLEISDNGPGIPLNLQDRLFEPFFTTKPQGVGVGLGLAISYGIIQHHQGRIELISDANGTCFTICLPRWIA